MEIHAICWKNNKCKGSHSYPKATFHTTKRFRSSNQSAASLIAGSNWSFKNYRHQRENEKQAWTWRKSERASCQSWKSKKIDWTILQQVHKRTVSYATWHWNREGWTPMYLGCSRQRRLGKSVHGIHNTIRKVLSQEIMFLCSAGTTCALFAP